MVKVGQTLHMGGQYGPLGEPDVLYFTQLHEYGHKWWALLVAHRALIALAQPDEGPYVVLCRLPPY